MEFLPSFAAHSGADPHSVGVDQFLGDEGAAIEAPLGINRSNPGIPGIDFADQFVGRIQTNEV
jgi:hypothetical protein